jgi:putative Mn2+ efflux pump MntP
MGFIEMFVIGVGLSMDAFSVSVCKGLAMKKIDYFQAVIIGLFFGGFQAIMPLIGWLLGTQFEKYIEAYDHWVAFILLAAIGGKMIIDVIRGGDEEACTYTKKLDYKELTVMSFATSVDALAVGISFGCLEVNIWGAMSIIGITTFAICVLGVAIGHKIGGRFKRNSTLAGGSILILIGLKILLEHLGVINF